jgi:hypothetical protein
MPRFFFDFRQGGERCPDAEGAEFASVEQAYLEAFSAAQDMWSEFLRQRQDPRRCLFEVRNDQRELLFVLPFQEVMDSCKDREVPPLHASFEQVTRAAERTRKVSAEFMQQINLVRAALEQSRALLRTKV